MKRNDKVKRGISVMEDKKKEKNGRTNDCKSKCANRNVKIYSKSRWRRGKRKKERRKERKKVEKKHEENHKLKQWKFCLQTQYSIHFVSQNIILTPCYVSEHSPHSIMSQKIVLAPFYVSKHIFHSILWHSTAPAFFARTNCIESPCLIVPYSVYIRSTQNSL